MEIALRQKSKNKFGQYFTPEIVANFMINMADIQPNSKILEPDMIKKFVKPFEKYIK